METDAFAASLRLQRSEVRGQRSDGKKTAIPGEGGWG